MLILFSNHTWRQLLSFCGGAPVRFTISGCSTECLTGPQFRWIPINNISQQTEQPPRSKHFFRLYHSHQSGTYKVVLNQLLPWQKKLVVPFRPNEISHVDIDKSGWKVAFFGN